MAVGKRVTIKDVAARAGIADMTVSRVVNVAVRGVVVPVDEDVHPLLDRGIDHGAGAGGFRLGVTQHAVLGDAHRRAHLPSCRRECCKSYRFLRGHRSGSLLVAAFTVESAGADP